MKNKRKYFIAECYETEEIENRKKQIDKDMASVLKTIKQGKIYAQVMSVSRSGMSRRILFFRVKGGGIERITAEVAWLCDAVTPGNYQIGAVASDIRGNKVYSGIIKNCTIMYLLL